MRWPSGRKSMLVRSVAGLGSVRPFRRKSSGCPNPKLGVVLTVVIALRFGAQLTRISSPFGDHAG